MSEDEKRRKNSNLYRLDDALLTALFLGIALAFCVSAYERWGLLFP